MLSLKLDTWVTCSALPEAPRVEIMAALPSVVVTDGVGTDIADVQMTVGGTGDVLAGFIGGLIAQHVEVFEACKQATRILGLIGENLM